MSSFGIWLVAQRKCQLHREVWVEPGRQEQQLARAQVSSAGGGLVEREPEEGPEVWRSASDPRHSNTHSDVTDTPSGETVRGEHAERSASLGGLGQYHMCLRKTGWEEEG